MKLNAIDKVCKILQYLYEGNTIKIDGYTYCMSENNEVGVMVYDENMISNEKMLLVDYSLNDFIKICDKLSNEDIFILCANKVLQDHNKI